MPAANNNCRELVVKPTNPLGANLLRLKEQWRLKGFCVKCGQGRAERGLYCYYHRKYHREQVAARRKLRRTLGICYQCGIQPVARAGLCLAHHAKMRERLARYVEQGRIPL